MEVPGPQRDRERSSAAAIARRDQVRQHWRLAAILFLGGGIGAIPSDALHQPAQPGTIYLLPLLAIVSAGVCWWISGLGLRARWLHVAAVVATLEVALTVALADHVFGIYYVFVAIYAAYVFQDRRAIVFQVGFASLAVLAPIVYDPDTARDTIVASFVFIPTLILAAASVTFLRERLEASELRYRQLAELDPLTEVGNYRLLADRLPHEMYRHRRRDDTLAVIAVDLDNFKEVNDRFGHQRGDEMLRSVAAALSAAVREEDVVVRQGGDEFCVLAPSTDAATAEVLAARLEGAVGALATDAGFLGATTGWAVYPEDGQTVTRLIAAADERLLAAKAANPAIGRRSASVIS